MTATLLLLAGFAAQASLEQLRSELGAGDYHSAWQELASEPDDLMRTRMRAEILYRAGDPVGALDAARAGLEIDPEQLDLLYYAAGSSVWMEDESDAVEYSSRLLRAAEALKAEPSEEQRAWKEAARGLAARSGALIERRNDLSRSLARLRFVGLGGVAAWLVAFWLVLRGQGRSRRPVS